MIYLPTTWILRVYARTKHFIDFCWNTLWTLFSTRPNGQQLLLHIKTVGVDSLSIIILTGSFTGLALSLQAYIGFMKFGAESLLSTVIIVGITRELGPVLTGLMVTGRSGSAMAAEIGTMQITEQIDALKTLCINPFQYVIVPRVLATIIVMPCLTLFSIACGMISAYFFCTYVLYINPEYFVNSMTQFLEYADIQGCLLKSCIFGFVLTLIGTYYGYSTNGGARGVGAATTQSMVAGSILILILNFFLTSLLFTMES